MEAFKFVLFLLAALTSFGCMALLFRGYARTGVRLLLVERAVLHLPDGQQRLAVRRHDRVADAGRPAAATASARHSRESRVLLYAFIWEAE